MGGYFSALLFSENAIDKRGEMVYTINIKGYTDERLLPYSFSYKITALLGSWAVIFLPYFFA